MAELPRSLPEFEARFPDDAACARRLLAKRWPDGFRCPACGHDKGWELGRERLTLHPEAGSAMAELPPRGYKLAILSSADPAGCCRPPQAGKLTGGER